MDVPSALTRWPPYPELRAHNLRDARLYADRADLIAALPIAKGGKVAEIGVWRAAFSKVLVRTLEPRQFFGFDIFTGHHYDNWNGLSGHQLFDGLTHRQYFEREMVPFLGITTIVEGRSQETLRDHTDRSFDRPRVRRRQGRQRARRGDDRGPWLPGVQRLHPLGP